MTPDRRGKDLARGDALFEVGDADGALQAYRAAAPGAASAWRIGRTLQLRGDVDDALIAYSVETGPVDAPLDVARLCAWRSTARFLRGDRDGCRRDAESAQRLEPDVADPATSATVHTALALVAALDGDRRLNELHYDAALRHAVAAADVLQQLRVRVNRGSRLLEEGDYVEAVDELDAGLALVGVRAFPTLEALGMTNRAEASFRLGRLEEAVADLAQARSLFQAAGSRMVAYSIGILGEVHRARGETALARLDYEEALRYSTESGDAHSGVRALCGLVFLLVGEDHVDAAAYLDRALVLGSVVGSVRLLLASCLVARARGDVELAQEHARAAGALARLHRDRPGLAEALELEAATTPARAAVLLGQALTVWRTVGDPLGQSRVLLRQAEEAARREPERALGLALTAGHQLRALGARGLAAQAATVVTRLEEGSSGTSVRCLGAFQVMRDGVAVPTAEWGSRKPRDLLKLLVSARGRPVTREELVAVLWPDQSSRAVGARLSVALSVLRRVLDASRSPSEGEALVVTREAVRLDLSVVDVDAERFLRLAEQARRQLAADQPSAPGSLEAAEVLYRGELLAEDRYEEWAMPLREHARETYCWVLRALAGATAETDPDAALRRYLRLLELDPYDEGAHLGLIRTLLQARRHGEARRRHSRYVERMNELGLPAQPLAPSR